MEKSGKPKPQPGWALKVEFNEAATLAHRSRSRFNQLEFMELLDPAQSLRLSLNSTSQHYGSDV
jgi:hypothetical protein